MIALHYTLTKQQLRHWRHGQSHMARFLQRLVMERVEAAAEVAGYTESGEHMDIIRGRNAVDQLRSYGLVRSPRGGAGARGLVK